jgi:hypothetical protein
LRATLVADADRQSKAYEEAQQKLQEIQDRIKQDQSAAAKENAAGTQVPENPTAASLADQNRAKVAGDLAGDAKARIAEQLALMREPKFAIVPNYFAWQPVAQLDLLDKHLYDTSQSARCDSYEAVLKVDAKQYTLKIGSDPNRRLVELATAIRSSAAPVAVRQDALRLRLVAVSTEILEIGLLPPAKPACDLLGVKTQVWVHPSLWSLFQPARPDAPVVFRAPDIDGVLLKWPGILLSFVLLSLGGPFWFNILKKTLNFRSLLAFKDDEERKARQADQTTAAAAKSSGKQSL